MDANELGFQPMYQNDGYGEFPPNTGITLRQHFAGLAMQGILASGIPGEHYIPKSNARDAVLFADSLLAELAKEPTT